MLGQTVLKVINQKVNLRRHYQNKNIWIIKEDFKLTCQQIRMNSKTAVKITVRAKPNNIDMIFISL